MATIFFHFLKKVNKSISRSLALTWDQLSNCMWGFWTPTCTNSASITLMPTCCCSETIDWALAKRCHIVKAHIAGLHYWSFALAKVGSTVYVHGTSALQQITHHLGFIQGPVCVAHGMPLIPITDLYPARALVLAVGHPGLQTSCEVKHSETVFFLFFCTSWWTQQLWSQRRKLNVVLRAL